jgi:hypothetical protein
VASSRCVHAHTRFLPVTGSRSPSVVQVTKVVLFMAGLMCPGTCRYLANGNREAITMYA